MGLDHDEEMMSTLLSLAIGLAERGFLPDIAVRSGMRRLIRQRLETPFPGLVENAEETGGGILARMEESPIALDTQRANEQHYEVPADFFRIVLGPRLKYSSGYYGAAASSLAEAENLMLEMTCRRAQLAEGQRILELGCGWGSLSLWMARRYPGSEIIAVSNSADQKAFIERAAADEDLTNIKVIRQDMNHFEPDGTFHRIVSVEMFEHMRNWRLLLGRIAQWMEPEGKLFLHMFCHRRETYFYESEGPDDWMADHFFTGGIMPSDHLIYEFSDLLRVDRHWRINGTHYARTIEDWLKRMDSGKGEVMEVLRSAYGPRQAGKWFARWRMFFMACSELFAYSGGWEWYVSHYLLSLGPEGAGREK
jgi:cyclopropane-fatty-acyl-phospholipid synthase